MKSIICETGGRAATGNAEAVPHCFSHLGKIRRSLAQDLIGLPKFAHLAFKLFDPRLFGTRLAWPFAAITLALADPNPKAVRRTTQFTRDRRQRRSFALIIIAVFHKQPHRAFAELGGIRLRGLLLFLFHNGQLSESFALRQTRGGSQCHVVILGARGGEARRVVPEPST